MFEQSGRGPRLAIAPIASAGIIPWFLVIPKNVMPPVYLSPEQQEEYADGLQAVLSLVGIVPGRYGATADGLNAYISYKRGDQVGMVLDVVSIFIHVPAGGFKRVTALLKESPAGLKALTRSNPAATLKGGNDIVVMDMILNANRLAGREYRRKGTVWLNGYWFKHNLFGQVKSLGGYLQKKTGESVWPIVRKTLKDIAPGYEAGHGIAKALGGPGHPANAFLQTFLVNRSVQKTIENHLIKALKNIAALGNGKKVYYRLDILWDPISHIPVQFTYTYYIGNWWQRLVQRLVLDQAVTLNPFTRRKLTSSLKEGLDGGKIVALNDAAGTIVRAEPTGILALLGLGTHLLDIDNESGTSSDLGQNQTRTNGTTASTTGDVTENTPNEPSPTPTVTLSKGDAHDNPDKGHWFDIDIEGLGPPYDIQCATVNLQTDRNLVGQPQRKKPRPPMLALRHQQQLRIRGRKRRTLQQRLLGF